MNASELTQLLHKPEAVNSFQAEQLEKILQEFPYFQGARSLLLKSLYKQDSFKYNPSLKAAAAYTADRSVLFDFITSDQFVSIQPAAVKTKEEELYNLEVQEPTEPLEEAKPSLENTLEESILATITKATESVFEKKEETIEKLVPESSLEKSILSSIQESENTVQVKTESQLKENQEVMPFEKPIAFEKNETHSFQEWLQLSKVKPISREDEEQEQSENTQNLVSKLELINRFIEANPKITPSKEDTQSPVFTRKNEDTSYLMTETLAKIYLEQKKYTKAIQAYEILILKYPEKSSLFADRISDIRLLQQNNN